MRGGIEQATCFDIVCIEIRQASYGAVGCGQDADSVGEYSRGGKYLPASFGV